MQHPMPNQPWDNLGVVLERNGSKITSYMVHETLGTGMSQRSKEKREVAVDIGPSTNAYQRLIVTQDSSTSNIKSCHL